MGNEAPILTLVMTNDLSLLEAPLTQHNQHITRMYNEII